MSDESKTTERPWHLARTAPENGTEIEYRCAGSDRIRQGSACHDFGGSFRFPDDMTEWRHLPGSPEAIVEAESNAQL